MLSNPPPRFSLAQLRLVDASGAVLAASAVFDILSPTYEANQAKVVSKQGIPVSHPTQARYLVAHPHATVFATIPDEPGFAMIIYLPLFMFLP